MNRNFYEINFSLRENWQFLAVSKCFLALRHQEVILWVFIKNQKCCSNSVSPIPPAFLSWTHSSCFCSHPSSKSAFYEDHQWLFVKFHDEFLLDLSAASDIVDASFFLWYTVVNGWVECHAFLISALSATSSRVQFLFVSFVLSLIL